MESLIELGFSKYDILLIQICPLSAVIGGLARFVVLDTNFGRLPARGGFYPVMTVFGRLKWVLAHVFVSAVLGLVFAFYFVGSVTEAPSTIAKLAAFSVLLGYAAPRLWESQEKIVMNVVERKLKELLEAPTTDMTHGPTPKAETSDKTERSAGTPPASEQ